MRTWCRAAAAAAAAGFILDDEEGIVAIGEGHAIPRARKAIREDDTELHSHSDLDRTATRIQSLALFFRTAPQTMDCQLSHSLRPSSAIPFNRSSSSPASPSLSPALLKAIYLSVCRPQGQ